MTAAAIDDVLARGVEELKAAPAFAAFDPSAPDLSQEAAVLRDTYGRLGSFTTGVVFVDRTGTVVLSYPSDLYPVGTQLGHLPHVQKALTSGAPTISDHLPPDTPARGRLDRLRGLLEQAIGDLRRLITALRPGILDQLGLIPAVRWMADQTLSPLGIEVQVEGRGPC